MAWIENNMIMEGARGQLGRQFVFKKRGTRTFISKMPVFSRNAVATSEQEKVRSRFAAAVAYARAAVKDPELKAAYAEMAGPSNTAYNIAFRDYFRSPSITDMDITKYDGSKGSEIVIRATDDFRVAEVGIQICHADGKMVEQGYAVLDPVDQEKWIYKAARRNTALAGTIIRVTARDIPGNAATMEKMVKGLS